MEAAWGLHGGCMGVHGGCMGANGGHPDFLQSTQPLPHGRGDTSSPLSSPFQNAWGAHPLSRTVTVSLIMTAIVGWKRLLTRMTSRW